MTSFDAGVNIGEPASTTNATLSTSHAQNTPSNNVKQHGMEQEQEHDISAKHVVQLMPPETASDTLRSMSTIDTASYSATDDVATFVSSLDGQPASVGEKSITSAATFAMDEKESLRPDDSASIAAAAEDEESQGRAADPVESSSGSNEDVRAFREQLNEISAIGPLQRSTPGIVNVDGVPLQGVLYATDVPALLQQTSGDEAMPDLKLLEALENPRDRIWVLKLEQDVIDFVKDAKESSLVLPQCNSFYRMLAHKIADYYMLGHSIDDSSSAVRLFKAAPCRMPRPLTGVVTPSTAASTPPPNLQMKILRRGVDISGPAIANGSNMPSKSTSENGESCNDDDPRKPATREEREARYEAARLRIMGSAKPVETVDAVIPINDESRSSSVSGRRIRKGKRDHSDDDFEARSAYNSYLAPLPGQGIGYQTQQYVQPGPQPMASAAFSQPFGRVPGHPQYPAQGVPGQYWYPPVQEEPTSWIQPQAPPFDLAREFDRSMSFQQAPAPTYSVPPSPYGQTTFQQPLPAPYGWTQGPPSNGHSSPAYPMHNTYNDRPQSSAGQLRQKYAYGQLPSQALGRPPNALEHPLPGSYKSRHFNPQSQAFIPGLDDNNLFRPYLPPRTVSAAAVPVPDRQLSSQPPLPQLDSPGHSTITSRMPPQSLTHPLPQPVFPSQVAVAAILPAKPTIQHTFDASRSALLPANAATPGDDTIAKWDTPASLPAKPPPSIEKHDTGKSMQYTAMPSFGSMPAGGAI